jgi:SAM-dependent methyltransferase
MAVHDVAAEGFGKEADTYERSRPTYPPDAVGWIVDALGVRPGRRICDLAAGTGILTALLARYGSDLIAVEPVPGMRTVLHAKLPHVPVASAVAEALPFADTSLDGVTVAQAFHWFDAPRALAELRRVLRVGGRLALVWNARERSRDWVNEVWSIMDRVEKRAPWRDHDGTTIHDEHARHERDLQDAVGYSALHTEHFAHEQELDHEGVVARVRGVSHVAVLDADAQARVLDEVRNVLSTHPETRDSERVRIPYRVDAYWLERVR